LELFLPIGLILVGLALIAVEVYLVPGFNVVGVFGFVVILFAIGFAFSETGLVGGIYALIGTVVVGGGLFYLMWTSGAWDRFVLATNLRSDEDSVVRESEHRAKYLGKSGVAMTPLRPTGVAEIDGERIEVVTEGEFIASGSKVRVVAMDRRRFFVRLADALAESAS
jgi:membrane-bound serine protease (ClpP class)